MFFPERIRLIAQTDRVLEIGPGGEPYHRSDILLEKNFPDGDEAAWQRGNTPKLRTDKSVIFYNGGSFPFRDKEFDYVICSHVLEHVPDVEFFVQELFRVAPKGYIEFPTVYYEYLYNFSVHLNLLTMREVGLVYMPKTLTSLSEFAPVQAVFTESLKNGYSQLIDDLKTVMFEGFEWTTPFSLIKAESLADVTPAKVSVPRAVDTAAKKAVKFFQKKLMQVLHSKQNKS